MGTLRPVFFAVLTTLVLVPPGQRVAATSHTQAEHIDLCTLVADPGNAFTFVRPPAPAIGSGLRARSLAASSISVTYVGFEYFPAAQAAFQHAVDIWASLVSTPVPIAVYAEFRTLDPGILGSAGANFIWRDFPGAPVPNSWYGDALADKLRQGDSYPGQFDISASFNSSYSNWYFGTDGATPVNQYDFVSVVLHELGHGLGFYGAANVSGGTGTLGTYGYPTIYDRFAITENGTQLLSFANPSAALGTQLTRAYSSANPRGPGVYWGGSNGVMAAAGVAPRLYTPSTWSSGSSYSHLDDNSYPAGDPNSLMTHALASAEAIHHPGPITLGIFADMGWSVNGTSVQAPRLDFNADGWPDLLFEHATGERYLWYMNGHSAIGVSPLWPYPMDPTLTIAAVNDFTGDGQPDLLLQNTADNRVTLYRMNGPTVVSEQVIQPTASPWKVMTSGDVNGDGHADIIWEDFSTGTICAWFMSPVNGSSTFVSWDCIRDLSGYGFALGPSAPEVVGTGDLNHDGKTDLVLHDRTSGAVRGWLLNGMIRMAETSLGYGSADPSWKLRAVGDYNNDGDADLIWQHTAGDLYIWFLSGSAFASGRYLDPWMVDPVWTVAGP